MDELDIDWMAPTVRQMFMEGVRMYAEAVRDGTVMHMQDGAHAMHQAEQLHLRLKGEDRTAASDPSI